MNTYRGKFSTFKRPSKAHQVMLDDIHAVLQEVFNRIRETHHLITVEADGSLVLEGHQPREMYPNLFLPEEDWQGKNYTSFDTVISYILYKLKQLGYQYNGVVEVQTVNVTTRRYARLIAEDGNLYCTDGELKVVYDDTNTYQVGGIALT
ncbi:MAG: hypothetical protein H9W81_13995 [Enterococcus sp.]|nr:hypothetical protein [Enterococcus sp.]